MPKFAADLSMMFHERAFHDRFDAAAEAGFGARHEPDGEELNFPFLFAELDRLRYDVEYNPRAGTVEGLDWRQPYRRA
jgi:hydroxypyruvate isomerase